MAERDVDLVPGARYWAGMDLPWYVPQSMVTSAAEDIGFRDVEWHDQSEPLPASVSPRSDPQYGGDWSEWATAVYRGQRQMYHLKYAPDWIVMAAPTGAPSPGPPAASNPTLVAESLKLLETINAALKSGDVMLMDRTATYLETHNMPALAATMKGAAADARQAGVAARRARAKRIALWAVGLGGGATVLLVGVAALARRFAR
jgi:hypothetical protein